jgi:hypothetical protein
METILKKQLSYIAEISTSIILKFEFILAGYNLSRIYIFDFLYIC